MAAFKKFDLFIGNDSGPTHMAAALGLPTLCVCSGTVHPAQWAPVGPAALAIQRQMLCSPCYLRDREECPFGVACLQDLPVEAVWEATLRVLLPKWSKLRGRSPLFLLVELSSAVKSLLQRNKWEVRATLDLLPFFLLVHKDSTVIAK